MEKGSLSCEISGGLMFLSLKTSSLLTHEDAKFFFIPSFLILQTHVFYT